MEDWMSVLQSEFNGDEGSFLLQLRCGSGWDRTSFCRLFYAMRACCKAHVGREHLPRWIAEGFWRLSWFPRSFLEHGGPDAVEPYDSALMNLDHLACWLFTGEGRSDDEFEPMDELPGITP